ncbi:hypothetical protein GQ457_14G013990 [Hibiscus cannabinus]
MNRGKQTVTPSRNRDIQCFKCLGRGHIASQCPNRHTMVIRESGEIETDSEKEEEDDTIEEEVNENVDFPADGEVLVVKRSLNTQVVKSDQQRENIFHTRCHINGKVCFVIIDGGSCTNVASTLMVQKLGLETTKHPHPYKLQWLNDGGELKVTKQVLIPFSIGSYKDEVLCDVVPMHATHMLLGRPWQFDRKVMHDGYSNRYSFTYDGKKHTLAPLSPQQVHDGQVHLKKSFEEFKEKEKKTVKIEIEQKNERENEVKAKRKGNGMSEIMSRGENRKMSVFARGSCSFTTALLGDAMHQCCWTQKAEKEAIPNQSLSGFDVIDEIKTAMEMACPKVVSCADILALAARDAVSAHFKKSLWDVQLGRRDGRVSVATETSGNISSLIELFNRKGLDVNDLVVLSGAHTIGVSHCGAISRRLYNFTGKGDADPSLDAKP